MPRYSLDAVDTYGTGATLLALAQWITLDGTTGGDSNAQLASIYGDGYGQYAPDGINPRKRKWTIVVAPLQDNLPIPGVYNLTNIRQFYHNVSINDWFYYTPMDWVPSIDGAFTPKWRIDKDTWVPTPLTQTCWSFTFSITQCFDPGA